MVYGFLIDNEQTWALPKARGSGHNNFCQRHTSRECHRWLWWTNSMFDICEYILLWLVNSVSLLNLLIELAFSCFDFQLSVTIDVPGEEPYHFQPRLFGKVWKFFAYFWNLFYLFILFASKSFFCLSYCLERRKKIAQLLLLLTVNNIIFTANCKLSHILLAFVEQIVPEKCRYQVLSTKIEIRLAKVEPINWTSLEYTKEVAVPQKLHVASGKPVNRGLV